MAIDCTVTPIVTYAANDTVNEDNLNDLGNPQVVVPDGKTLGFAVGHFADGTKAAPSLALTSEITTGLYRKSAGVLGFATGGADVVSLSSGGITLETGKVLVGKVQGATGTVSAPSLSFEGKANYGLYVDTSSIFMAVNGVDVMVWGASAVGIVQDTIFAEGISVLGSATVAGSVAITGDLTVSGKFSGALANIVSGVVSSPGLPLASTGSSGLYEPPLDATVIHRFGVSIGQSPILHAGRKATGNPWLVVTPDETVKDYSLYDSILHIVPATGQAAINFQSGTVSGGSGTMDTTHAPSPTGGTLWIKGYVGSQKVVFPCVQHTW